MGRTFRELETVLITRDVLEQAALIKTEAEVSGLEAERAVEELGMRGCQRFRSKRAGESARRCQ